MIRSGGNDNRGRTNKDPSITDEVHELEIDGLLGDWNAVIFFPEFLDVLVTFYTRFNLYCWNGGYVLETVGLLQKRARISPNWITETRLSKNSIKSPNLNSITLLLIFSFLINNLKYS